MTDARTVRFPALHNALAAVDSGFPMTSRLWSEPWSDIDPDVTQLIPIITDKPPVSPPSQGFRLLFSGQLDDAPPSPSATDAFLDMAAAIDEHPPPVHDARAEAADIAVRWGAKTQHQVNPTSFDDLAWVLDKLRAWNPERNRHERPN